MVCVPCALRKKKNNNNAVFVSYKFTINDFPNAYILQINIYSIELLMSYIPHTALYTSAHIYNAAFILTHKNTLMSQLELHQKNI